MVEAEKTQGDHAKAVLAQRDIVFDALSKVTEQLKQLD